MTQRLIILIILLAFFSACSQVESKQIFMAKKNVSNYARDLPGAKKHEIVAVKSVKDTEDARKFLKKNGVTSSIIRVNSGDIVLVVRIYYRLQWMGKNIIFVCDSRGKMKDMIERTRPERPYVRW
ncbi:MAG: hypothetical protein ABH886_00900 [Candidatus Desantisbacteria bacterium]